MSPAAYVVAGWQPNNSPNKITSSSSARALHASLCSFHATVLSMLYRLLCMLPLSISIIYPVYTIYPTIYTPIPPIHPSISPVFTPHTQPTKPMWLSPHHQPLLNKPMLNTITITCPTYTHVYLRRYPQKPPCDMYKLATSSTQWHFAQYTIHPPHTIHHATKMKTHIHTPLVHPINQIYTTHMHTSQTAKTTAQNTQKRCYHHETIPMLSPTIVLSPPNHV